MPTARIYDGMEGGLGRRPLSVRAGSPIERDASAKIHGKIYGGRARPEAVLYRAGKPDSAEGPLLGSANTLQAAMTGGLVICKWEARQSGRPDATIQGKIDGGRAMPEAVLYTTGKPVYAGGPLPRSA